jgi:hypothetical protein
MQLAGVPSAIPQNANAGGQQLDILNDAAMPVPMMLDAQSGPQVQAPMEYGHIRSSQGSDRAEDAIKTATRISPLHSRQQNSNFNTQRPSETSQNPSLLALLKARQGGSQGQPYEAQLFPRQNQVHSQPVEPYARTTGQFQARQYAMRVTQINGQLTQEPSIRGAVQGQEPYIPSGHAAMSYGHRQNAFPTQQFNTAPVQMRPSLRVTQNTRSATERSGGTSLEAAGGYHRQDQRCLSGSRTSHNLNPATSQNVASTANSQPQAKRSMGPPLPTVKRGRSDTSGSTSQDSPSQNLGPQVLSSLVNMGHPIPALSAVANTNRNLFQQRPNATPQLDGILIMPGQYTPIPAALPYAVSSSPAQGEKGSRTTTGSGSSQGPKTRVTIAIAGCPSSGKSMLAYLLAAVFEGATIRDTGFAGAQTMYPVFNAKFEENPNRKGPITKVIVTHQNSYIKPVEEWPIAEWTELYPYSPAMEITNPQTGAARALADLRGQSSLERYWEEAYKANIGVDPSAVSNAFSSRYPQMVPPAPMRMSKEGPNLDCRGAVAWEELGKAINDGMRGHKNEEGSLETEEGRDKIASYLAQPDPKTRIPLVNSRKLEPLRERIRDWIRDETAHNDRIGFPGRSVVDGSLRQIFIFDGSLIFLQTHPDKGAGGEKLLKVCDVKLFLPTLKEEAIQRCFSQREYMNPPRGIRKPEQTWMYEGYFSEVAW